MINWKVQRENCRSKNSYDKRGAVTVVNKWWKEEHKELKAYACPCCKKWHVTSKK